MAARLEVGASVLYMPPRTRGLLSSETAVASPQEAWCDSPVRYVDPGAALRRAMGLGGTGMPSVSAVGNSEPSVLRSYVPIPI